MPTQIHDNCFPDYYVEKQADGDWHNMMWGTDLSVGGYVYASKGMYLPQENNKLAAITFDAASLHPTDTIELNAFGKYTEHYANLLKTRLLIKHKNYDEAKKMFDGKLERYLSNKDDAKNLSTALKTALNSTYGLSYASYENAARDPRNANNIIALRGALVMRTLQKKVTDMGYHVIHIKTDSIKIANPDQKIFDFVMNFGKHYGITYEVEHTWKKICLVNDAVFVGQHGDDDPESPGEWETTGKQFQVPYVRKSLFTHESIDFYDMCETYSVGKGTLHLVDNENDIFVGKVGLFCPMKEHGMTLYRVDDKGKRFAPSKTTGYLWMEAENVKERHLESSINLDFYRKLCDDAIAKINEYGDFNTFAQTN